MSQSPTLSNVEQAHLAKVAALHEKEPHQDLDPQQLRVHLSLHAVVEAQLDSGSPACARLALERLVEQGMERHQALHAICNVVAAEAFAAIQQGGHYDEARYCEALAALQVKPE